MRELRRFVAGIPVPEPDSKQIVRFDSRMKSLRETNTPGFRSFIAGNVTVSDGLPGKPREKRR